MLHRSLSTLYTVWGGLCLMNTLGERRCGRVCIGMMSIIVRVLVLCVDTRLCMSLQSHFNDSLIHLMSSVISRLPSYCIMCVPRNVKGYLWPLVTETLSLDSDEEILGFG